MKKFFATFMVLMIFATAVSAQDGDKKSKKDKKEKKERTSFFKKDDSGEASFNNRKLTFSVNFSPTFSSYKVKSEGDVINQRLGRRFNFSYGFGAQYHLTPNFSVLSGVNFVSRGGKMRNYNDLEFDLGGTSTVGNDIIPEKTLMKYKVRDLQIPAIARWTTDPQGDKQNLKIYGEAGIGLNYGMRARASFINDDADVKLRRKDISEEYKNFDINMTFGAGVIKDWNSKLDYFMGISYSRGVVNMSKNFDAIRNRAWTVDFGFIF